MDVTNLADLDALVSASREPGFTISEDVLIELLRIVGSDGGQNPSPETKTQALKAIGNSCRESEYGPSEWRTSGYLDLPARPDQ
ncbi:hypothetical protein LTR50_000611 [Elasticomyces elasticus]|nr:hypothetical protein LTR50_000611 [Elasticomyces elasticus]